MTTAVGFVGLGNMGAALATNLVEAGHDVLAYDIAGATRCPVGASFVADVPTLTARAGTVVFSLPDGAASGAVAAELVRSPERSVTAVVDTSTIGPAMSASVAALLSEAGVGYLDAPVSGGVAGAKARTLAVMYAGAPEVCEAVDGVLAGLTDRHFHVGDRPGMAQALKLANNFLSATALVATSEAVAFCTAVGIDIATALEVINASSGRSAASEDKFVNHVLPGTYASGFLNTLMAKDLGLYLAAVDDENAPASVAAVTADLWQRFAALEPGVDFTNVFRFVKGR